MTTRNNVPRNDNEGEVGVDYKRWSEVNAVKVHASNNIILFNNVAEMKAVNSNKIRAGYTLRTLGFYTAGDGGGADYVIVDNIGEDEADEATLIPLQNGLYAKLTINNLTNVAQLGAKNDGIENAINIFNIAKNKVGKVVIPNGIFNVDGDLEDTVLYFMGGTITGTLNVNNVEIQAPLDTIFGEITLTGQIKNNEIHPQWWGAKPLQIKKNADFNSLHGKASDCSEAINKAITFAGTYKSEEVSNSPYRNCGRPNIMLSKGFWRIDNGLDLEMIDISPSLIGDGKTNTVLDFSGLSESSTAITIGNGIGGTSNKGCMGWFRIYGNDTVTLLNLSDCLGYTFREITFEFCDLSCNVVNNKTGTYSEQNKFIDCYFAGSAKQKFKFSVVNGTPSFRGFGIINCYIEQFIDRAPMMEIGKNCSLYHVDLDFDIHISKYEGTTIYPIIKHNGSSNLTAKGTIQIEHYMDDLVLVEPNRMFLVGGVYTWSKNPVKLGSLWLIDALSAVEYKNLVQYRPRVFSGTLDKEKTFRFPSIDTSGTMYTVEVFISDYSFRGCYIIYSDYNADITADVTKVVKIIDERMIADKYSYGKPTIKAGTEGELIVTPSDTLPSTATILVVATQIGNDRRGVTAYEEV